MADPTVIAAGIAPDRFALRPPNDTQILYRPIDQAGLWVMDADGTGGHLLFAKETTTPSQWDFAEYEWSPDGTKVAFMLTPGDLPNEARIWVMNADGTNPRQLTDGVGNWFEGQMKWSPDSTHIAFNRWLDGVLHPIGIVSIDGGPVLDAGPVPVDEEAFDYSPDGLTLWTVFAKTKALAIDVHDGSFEERPWPTGMVPTWQRAALDH